MKAAVPFYGPQPSNYTELAKTKAAVSAVYAELDTRITGTIPAVEEAMKKYNKIYEKAVYPGADHAFNNDTGPRYNAEAPADAWRRTLAWFDKYVRG